jgi:hypothetical protein
MGEDNRGTQTPRREVLRAAGVLTGTGLIGVGAAKPKDNIGGEGPPFDPPSEERPNACGGGNVRPPHPGPEFLYDDNPTPPQLENTGGWSATPLMVSGTEGYDDGEYLYQDFVYDDHGANTSPAPTPPNPRPDATYGAATGDYVYPTNHQTYRDNAADLLEFRCRYVEADGDNDPAVVYRFTLQTMVEPDAAAIAVGIDTGRGDRTDWGHGLGDLGAGVDHVLVVSGDEARLDGSTDRIRSTSVDVDRSQLELTSSHG